MEVTQNKNNIFNTIRWKAVIAASIGTLMLCLIMLFVNHKIITDKIYDYSKLSSNIQIDKYAYSFEKQLSNTILNINAEANTITEQIEEINQLTLKVALKTMKSYIKKDATIKSMFIISEPYVLNNSDSLLVNTNPGFPIGWYGKLIKRENLEDPEFTNDLEASSAEIYELYRDIKHDYQQRLTILEIDGEITNSIVYMIPFFNKGKFGGILGVDIDLKYYRNMLDEIIPKSENFILVDKDGNIFYSRKKEYQNKNINETLRYTEENFNILSKTSENLSIDTETKLIENNNQKVFLHNKKISIPTIDDNFALISIIPTSQLKINQQKNEATIIIITSLLLALYIICLIIISKQIAKPINTLKSVVKQIASGNFDFKINKEINDIDSAEFKSLLRALENLTNSLKQTAQFATEIRDGNLDAEYKVSIKNNTIGTALVSMRDSMIEARNKEQIRLKEEKRNQWATEGHSVFSDILRNNISDIKKLSNEVIDNLVPYIDVNQGGIFVKTTLNDEAKTEVLELYGVFAFSHQIFHKRILRLDEGLIGACAMEKHTIILNNVPENYADISSGLGKAKPKAIMFVPLVYNDILYGVMEFASFKEFEPYKIAFVERISENVASTIANAKINEQTSILLQQSREQSKLMEEKEANLRTEIESLTGLIETSQNELSQIEKVQFALNKTIMNAIFSLKGETLEANRKFCLRYMLDVNDIKRKNIYEILQLTLTKYDEFKKVWDTVKQGSTETYIAEFKINNNTRKIKNILVPIFDSDNIPERILCLAFDVTNQINTEEELNRMQKQYSSSSEDTKTLKKQLKQLSEDVEQLNKELMDSKRQNVENRQKYDKASSSAQFFKRELEKRITKFRKIEANLKEKVKLLENKLYGNQDNQNPDTDEQSSNSNE
ncbi:MAG: GAF domain-containing protein [Bacteroidales bacterium]|nr:GAF domain-containing protein [Bacteroidales bacterium]